jgi:hypothetical protein
VWTAGCRFNSSQVPGFHPAGFGCKMGQASLHMKLMGSAKRVAAILAAILVLIAGLGISEAEAGFRSPESLIRNVYAYYGRGTSEFSNGLPRDAETARQFFDSSLSGPGARDETRPTISWSRARPGSSALLR